ncbi:MAG: ComEC/Rec2 family competence protein [Prevotella sp.]|nr:ComEC/Rec2 family competence protein [Prevotella sp.]
MIRRLLAEAPTLPLLAAVVAGILLFFPPDFQQPSLPFVGRAADNMLALRDILLSQYRAAGISDEAYAVLSAMTLGDKTALTDNVRQLFNDTGASHILALSGLHLGMVYMVLSLLVPCRRWRMVSQVVTILGIWMYAFLTGLSPSIVRSATMLTIYGIMSVGYRERMSLNVLSFTAFCMLVVSPVSLYNAGFQMSFLAVAAILMFHPLINGIIPAHIQQSHTVLRWLWGMTTVSLSAQIGVAPLIAFYFHRFSTYFLLSNFVVVPCAWLVLMGSLLFFATHLTVVAWGLSATVGCMLALLGSIASLPASTIGGLYPNVAQTVLAYLFIICIYIAARAVSR